MSNSKLVTAAAFGSPMAAHAARTKLESEGIECFIADENTIAVNWLYSAAVGGVKVQVYADDLERAQALLEVPAEEPPAEVRRFNSVDVRCPKCGLSHLRYRGFSGPIAAISWLLPWFSKRWPRSQLQCQGCGFEWVPDRQD